MGPTPPWYAGMMSNIRLQDGQFARALEPLDAILKTIKEPGVGFFLPEIHRLRAECLLRIDPSNFDVAIRELELAIATAKQQQARVFWLRAAISLARVWTDKGMQNKGVAQLQEVVSVFSGDDNPPELATARQILSGHSS
jgi:predicted ATPase